LFLGRKKVAIKKERNKRKGKVDKKREIKR
jgi:hypothetical protein